MLSLLLACNPPVGDDSASNPDSGEEPSLAEPPAIVPVPSEIIAYEGSFVLDAHATIEAEGLAAEVAEQLAAYLRPATGYSLPVQSEGEITLSIEEGFADEGYSLAVSETGIVLTASTSAGLFYGVQTLRQLFSPAIFGSETSAEWTVPLVTISDSPRFAWRAAMIDVARHFFTVAEIERQIDLMALHKLNRLHLHLTDDQGWRIEIGSWPDLALIGGQSEVGGGPGGYYSQTEFRELVAYAADRYVTVVPEIDFPGHANAALASYPELNESGVAADIYTGEGVISTPLWLHGPDTAQFVADVWGEVASLTPDGVVHMGGDEAIDTSKADYQSFVQSVRSILADNNKSLLGWDEVGTVPLTTPFLAQYWYEPENARDAVAQGGQLISSPAEFAYLDMVQSADAEYGQIWAGMIDTEQAYSWDPVLDGTTEADMVGVEGCLWTEYIDDEAKMDFMLWPRLAALAEVGWSGEANRDWTHFSERLVADGARLTALDVGYYRDPSVDWE